jgi:hypothetical protein
MANQNGPGVSLSTVSPFSPVPDIPIPASGKVPFPLTTLPGYPQTARPILLSGKRSVSGFDPIRGVNYYLKKFQNSNE